jgi:hypothetical protein
MPTLESSQYSRANPKTLKMASREQTITAVRILHFAFLATIFLFILFLHFAAPTEAAISLSIVAAIACAALADIAFGVTNRRKYMDTVLLVLTVESDEAKALRLWRVANIISFVHAETVALLGFALKVLGANWKIAGPFFTIGFLLLLLWTPRLELPVSASRPAPPPPMGTD